MSAYRKGIRTTNDTPKRKVAHFLRGSSWIVLHAYSSL